MSLFLICHQSNLPEGLLKQGLGAGIDLTPCNAVKIVYLNSLCLQLELETLFIELHNVLEIETELVPVHNTLVPSHIVRLDNMMLDNVLIVRTRLLNLIFVEMVRRIFQPLL